MNGRDSESAGSDTILEMNDRPHRDQATVPPGGAASNLSDPRSAQLLAPWRMDYIMRSGEREPGCIFCNRLAGADDVEQMVLFRGEDVFAIMNLFPYNTGHIMVVPNAHQSSPQTLDAATLTAAALLMQRSLRALRLALSCKGFNVGLNVGATAGAGIADHMHHHIVPRWTGDANFMPILGGTMVMPELYPVTYAEVRAELFQAEDDGLPAVISCFDGTGSQFVVDASGQSIRLPLASPVDGEPLWRTAHLFLQSAGIQPQLFGWGGTAIAAAGQRSGFCVVAQKTAEAMDGLRFIPFDEAVDRLGSTPESELLDEARKRSRGAFAELA
ncbi:hypothetical protein BH24CHL4_BH24CHL4_04360 [soil metagenome]